MFPGAGRAGLGAGRAAWPSSPAWGLLGPPRASSGHSEHPDLGRVGLTLTPKPRIRLRPPARCAGTHEPLHTYSHDRLGVGGLLAHVAVWSCQGAELALKHTQGLALRLARHLQGQHAGQVTIRTQNCPALQAPAPCLWPRGQRCPFPTRNLKFRVSPRPPPGPIIFKCIGDFHHTRLHAVP